MGQQDCATGGYQTSKNALSQQSASRVSCQAISVPQTWWHEAPSQLRVSAEKRTGREGYYHERNRSSEMGKGTMFGINYSDCSNREQGQLEEVLHWKHYVACPVAAAAEMLGLASCTPGQLVFLAAEMELL